MLAISKKRGDTLHFSKSFSIFGFSPVVSFFSPEKAPDRVCLSAVFIPKGARKNHFLMPVSDKYLAKLVPGHFFHVYNRTNNKELLFLDDEDRSRFLLSYFYYLSPMVDTFAYCLLPNHF
ncbi:hypothetical protein RZS08_24310, partial [Arthrospira platensis SPKY1]|nr:hypothetical protein [Arthrospira platensis SPKY1]